MEIRKTPIGKGYDDPNPLNHFRDSDHPSEAVVQYRLGVECNVELNSYCLWTILLVFHQYSENFQNFNKDVLRKAYPIPLTSRTGIWTLSDLVSDQLFGFVPTNSNFRAWVPYGILG